MSTAEGHHRTRTVSTADGVELVVQRWSPAGDTQTRAHLLLVHGYAEHAMRYQDLALHLAPHGFDVWVPDLRGHGKSPGARGYVRRFDDYAQDIIACLGAMPQDGPRFLIGHSNGGLAALDVMRRYAPVLDGVVLSNPFLELAVPAPRMKAALGRILARVYPKIPVPSGLDASGLTRDEQIAQAYVRDPLVFKTVTPGYFEEAKRVQREVRAMDRLAVPLLYIYSDDDRIASSAANRELASKLEAPEKTVWCREGERHEVFNELDRYALFEDVAGWLEAHS